MVDVPFLPPGPILHSNARLLFISSLFSVEKFFPEEIIQFSSWHFFPCPEISHDAQNWQVYRVNGVFILHVSSFNAVRKPELAGLNPAIDHTLYVFLDTRQHVFNF